MNCPDKDTQAADFLPFDPLIPLADAARRWFLILLAAVAAGAVTLILYGIFYTPTYETTLTFAVTTAEPSGLSTTSGLAKTASDLFSNPVLHRHVLQSAELSGFDFRIRSALIPETNLLTVTVTASDPAAAHLVARSILDRHGELTGQILDGIILEVLQPPAVPTEPSNPSRGVPAAGSVMLLAAIAAAGVLAYLSFQKDTLRSPEEMRKKLNCPCLGALPHHPAPALRPEGSGYWEDIRKLRLRVVRRMGERGILMITSCAEGEGKSTVAANLALALTQKGKNVLLIHYGPQAPACPGLQDVLAGKISRDEAIRRDGATGLYRLPARVTADCGDLISGPGMRELLCWAKAEFDYVILDTPAMAAAADAEILAGFADAALLVVLQNLSRSSAVNRSIALLEQTPAQLLGCVLNGLRAPSYLYDLLRGCFHAPKGQ